ncbi:hypothetical protein DFH09DRAFT_1354585 [Mycena vulgaris]|nr:hypothetical protein DFH09DRAFT_1354585 [Mycena vulgaris]
MHVLEDVEHAEAGLPLGGDGRGAQAVCGMSPGVSLQLMSRASEPGRADASAGFRAVLSHEALAGAEKRHGARRIRDAGEIFCSLCVATIQIPAAVGAGAMGAGGGADNGPPRLPTSLNAQFHTLLSIFDRLILPTFKSRYTTRQVQPDGWSKITIGTRATFLSRLLPAFYANLDPADIPIPDVVHSANAAGTNIDAVVAAIFSLRAIQIPALASLPPEAYSEIWARARSWIEWLHIYAEPEKQLYAIFSGLFVQFQYAGSHRLVDSTPGVRAVVATAWNMFLDNPEGDELHHMTFFPLKNLDSFIIDECLEDDRWPRWSLNIWITR